MHINNQIFLWDQATVKLLDVRQIEMVQSEILQKYKIPASIFLLSVHGSAQVQLDQAEFSFTGFQILHSGKGATLNIVPTSKKFVYYIIYYRAWIHEEDPFQIQYCFSPNAPILLYNKFQMMHQKWNRQEERLHVKSLFYQFIDQVLKELHKKRMR